MKIAEKDNNTNKSLIEQTFQELEKHITSIPGFDDLDEKQALNFGNAFKITMAAVIKKGVVEKLWREFENEIKHNRHFFPQAEILRKIEKLANNTAIGTVGKNQELFRVREFKKDQFIHNQISLFVLNELKKEFPSFGFEIEDLFDTDSFIFFWNLLYHNSLNNQFVDKLNSIIQTEYPYYGLKAKDNDAPPIVNSKEGRCNPKGISYLYSSLDEKTAIMEMRPQIGKMYSVARIILKNDIKVFDLTLRPEAFNLNEMFGTIGELQNISGYFSELNHGDSIDYLPTQYICEYIKTLGFDGVKYNSAVSKDGVDLILFDTSSDSKLYEIDETYVVSVTEMDINLEKLLPFPDKTFDYSETIDEEM